MSAVGPTHSGSDQGSVTIWMMLVPVLVLIMGGLTLDLWGAMAARSRVAAIADEAAVAGATAVELRWDGGRQEVVLVPEEARARAVGAVDTHPDLAVVTSRVAHATSELVTVTVTGQYDPLLLRLVGAERMDVRVTGAAAPASR